MLGMVQLAAAQNLTASVGDPGLNQQLQQLLHDAAAQAPGSQPLRVDVRIGQLDPRLRLAPCQRIEPQLPSGTRLLGHTRVGLRCVQGPVRWHVYLPVTVRLLGPGLVARQPLSAGTLLQAEHLEPAEVDWAARPGPVLLQPQQAVGRILARTLPTGEALRRSDLKLQRWFEAGETVRVLAAGSGFAIASEGRALNPGVEGQTVQVRLPGGRLVSGTATGPMRVELAL